jgi:hypothetical protein
MVYAVVVLLAAATIILGVLYHQAWTGLKECKGDLYVCHHMAPGLIHSQKLRNIILRKEE